MRIRTHRELEVHKMAFDAAMEIFELSKGGDVQSDGSNQEVFEVGMCQSAGG